MIMNRNMKIPFSKTFYQRFNGKFYMKVLLRIKLSFFFSIKKVLSTSYNPVFLSEGLQMKKKNNWKNKKKYQILTSILYFCNCTAMSPKLSGLGKVLLVPSKAPPCDTQPSTFSHVIISRSPLTRPSKPDLIPKGLFPSLMHVRTNDLTGRKKKCLFSFWLSILKTNHHFREKRFEGFRMCKSISF